MNDALRKAQEAMAEKRARGEEIVRLDPIQKAQANPKSLRLAVNGKCWDCVGGAADPGPRQRIGQCSSTDCTLWPVRPYQKYAENAYSSGEDSDPVGDPSLDDLI